MASVVVVEAGWLHGAGVDTFCPGTARANTFTTFYDDDAEVYSVKQRYG